MIKQKVLTLLVLLAAVVTGAMAQTTYKVSVKEGTDDATSWQGKAGTGEYKALPLEGVAAGTAVTVKYNGKKRVKSVKAVKEVAEEPVTLATPLTVEAITAGTIQVNIDGTLSTGMNYSVNGGTTKTTIYNTKDIPVAKGDKVQFYGNGTQTQDYGNNIEVKIQGNGDGFKTKVYGNIMSLLDETGFATKTDLPNASYYVFYALFQENATLIDASELLLPAATLAAKCYQKMFEGCTNLTTAPKLPATTLADACYSYMFNGCTKLTSAYVKAAYTADGKFKGMFNDCTATGAVLHTTSDNKASWETMMGTGKTWSNWTVADDWQE